MSSASVVSWPSAPAGGEETALVLDGVTRRFGGLMALSGVSVVLPRGGRLAVIGPNGAGKTTLFRLISGEMRASDGTISLFGEDVSRASERGRARRGIARTFQVSNLFAELSVLDNVRIAAQARSNRPRRFWWPVGDRDEYTLRARGMLERVGLGRRERARVADLSHGEQRQLEIGRAHV